MSPVLISKLPFKSSKVSSTVIKAVLVKVKASYRVFPSAYASVAFAKCRKVGAANYGKSSKKAKKKATGGVLKMAKGGIIARGCGQVDNSRRKRTRTF